MMLPCASLGMYSNSAERHPYPQSHSTAPLMIRNPSLGESLLQFCNPAGGLSGTETVPQPDFAALKEDGGLVALGG